MMENFQAIVAARKAQQIEQSGPVQLKVQPKQEASRNSPTAGNPEPAKRARLESNKNISSTEDKENTPPKPGLCDQDVISDTKNHSENDNQLPDEPKDCGKCVKRRLTDVQEPNDCSVPKRAKQCENNNNNNSENCDSSEPMQTDISSLVQRFNAGLSNFLGSSTGHVAAKNGKHAERLNGQGQGPISCSTQVNKPKESFTDKLSRPAIALAV